MASMTLTARGPITMAERDAIPMTVAADAEAVEVAAPYPARLVPAELLDH